MKNFFKKIIMNILAFEAKMVLKKYKPKIIAVTGTVGKTTTKEMIFLAISSEFEAERNKKNLNNEFGVPLTILGLETAWNDPLGWLKNIFWGALKIFKYPDIKKWLVLEVGVDHLGDIDFMKKFLKTDVVVFTEFGDETPVHVENFKNAEELFAEKLKLLDTLRPDGVLILNGDRDRIKKIKSFSRWKTFLYGLDLENDISATNLEILYRESEEGKSWPIGMSAKINCDGNVIPLSVFGTVGEHFIYSALAGMTVAKALGVNLLSAQRKIEKFHPEPGRMRILEGKSDSILIDDTYNSSPISTLVALKTLKEIKSKGRKIAILGDMLELGKFTKLEHSHIGEIVFKNKIKELYTVGLRSVDIYQSAKELGLKKVRHFSNSSEACEFLKDLPKKGDCILVKGSQSMRMEKITQVLLADQALSKKLLVRQEEEWKRH